MEKGKSQKKKIALEHWEKKKTSHSVEMAPAHKTMKNRPGFEEVTVAF